MTERPPVRLRDRLFRGPRLGGLFLAIVFFWESLNPTLLPRSIPVQALLTGACTAIGYAVGASVSVVVGFFLTRAGRGPLCTGFARRALWGLAIFVGVLGAFVWATWQNDQRDLVRMPHMSRAGYLGVLLAGGLIFVVLMLVGRLIGQGLVAFDRVLGRVLPRWVAFTATVLLFAVVLVTVTRDFVVNPVFDAVNSAYGTLDDTTEAGVHEPTSDLVSGGPDSLVPWDTLGVQGRTFTGDVTTPAQLEKLVEPGTPVMQPIRVYVGLQSADDAKARAELAVRELVRTGAFDRRVLVVGTSTGTGWINPRSARAVEAINGGDTAFVSMQYSYLPSWISFLVDTDVASEAGEELFTAVYDRWEREPVATRPQLVVFGESLGSFGSEHAFNRGTAKESVAQITDETDGALWVGPTYSNPVRTPLVRVRDQGSPTWRPEIGNGDTVTFTNTPSELLEVDGQPVVYLQHPSDPVGWWDWSAMYEKPLWLQGPRGYDVPKRAHWFPFVTWAQTSTDLIAGFAAPPGHGHNYNDAWPEAWAAVAAPDGWTTAQTHAIAKRLEAYSAKQD
ncbi:MAG: alpha/beta-hydrolase family protein [Acidimicrobiia bacterium]|jgi:uncharacterized membrane protein